MRSNTHNRSLRQWSGALAAAAILASTTGASAQEAESTQVSPTGKGIVGGALLGGEIGVMATAAFGAEEEWAYWVAMAAGAAAGGVGGYFVEQSLDTPVSFYLLAGGMGLIIPAAIVFLDSTYYKDPETLVVDQAQASLPPLVARKRGGQWSTATVVSLGERTASVSVPAISVAPVYSREEQRQFGVTAGTQVVVPVLGGLF